MFLVLLRKVRPGTALDRVPPLVVAHEHRPFVAWVR
jgi:hypothetical protein